MALAGLGGFASGLEGGLNSGQQFQQNRMKLSDEQTQRAGMQAAGKAILSMFGGQVPGQQAQPPAPGQPSQPLGSGQAPPPAGMQAQDPQNQGLVSGVGQMLGQPGGPPQGGASPQQAVPPGAPSGAPQGGPPQGGRQMDWRSIIQGVQKANPGAPPEVIIAAVNQFIPIMSAQSQAEWRQAQVSLGQGRLAQGQERVEQGGQRVQQGDRRLDQGDRRAGRLDKALDETIQYHQKMLDSTREKITNAKTQQERDFYLKAYKERLTKRNADLQAQVKAAASGGMGVPPELQKKLDAAAAQSDRDLQQLQTGQAPAQGGDAGGKTVKPGDFSPTKDPVDKDGYAAGQKGNPIPDYVLNQYKAGVAKSPEKKAQAIAALREAGYDTSGLEAQ